jgi:hypothetical protein
LVTVFAPLAPKWPIRCFRRCARHFAARSRALAARFGTLLAVLHLVLRAFFAACIADFGAKLAYPFRELRSARHLAHCERTYVGAAPVKFDAARHHFDVVLVQTRGRTVFASLHALVARLDTIFIFFVSHILFFRSIAGFHRRRLTFPNAPNSAKRVDLARNYAALRSIATGGELARRMEIIPGNL